MMNHWPQLSRALEGDVLRVISHGGGVQTTALCLMAARGDVGPMPDAAVFADTGGESAETYAYLDWLETQLPFPLIRARRDGPTLAEQSIAVASGERSRKGANLPPWFTLSPRGDRGMMPKHCSGSYNRDVVVKEVRRLLGYTNGRRLIAKEFLAESWFGISKDEIWRVQQPRKKYLAHRYPLVEANMTRQDCIRWLEERQYRVPPKSSCVFCPYRTNAQWRQLRDLYPADFDEAVRVDHAIRQGGDEHEGTAYVHRQCVPLDQADLHDDNPDQMALPLGADCDSCGL